MRRILELAEKPAEYWYIRTRRELESVLRLFGKSTKRYLHVSCHGSNDELSTTLDKVPIEEFSRLAGPYLGGRRLFLSACEIANRDLATAIFSTSGCLSMIGPAGSITFSDAATMWASFYHLMFKQRPIGMRRQDIKQVLHRIANTFLVPMHYFGRLEDGSFS